MNHVRVLKTPDEMKQGIDFSNLCQKLVAQSFTPAGPLYEPCDITNLKGARGDFLRSKDFPQLRQTGIVNSGHPYIGLNCRERIVGHNTSRTNQSIKDGGLPHVREPNHSATESHGLQFVSLPVPLIKPVHGNDRSLCDQTFCCINSLSHRSFYVRGFGGKERGEDEISSLLTD